MFNIGKPLCAVQRWCTREMPYVDILLIVDQVRLGHSIPTNYWGMYKSQPIRVVNKQHRLSDVYRTWSKWAVQDQYRWPMSLSVSWHYFPISHRSWLMVNVITQCGCLQAYVHIPRLMRADLDLCCLSLVDAAFLIPTCHYAWCVAYLELLILFLGFYHREVGIIFPKYS